MKIISFAYSLSSSSAFICYVQVQEHHPHQCAPLQVAGTHGRSHIGFSHIPITRVNLVEFPLTTISLCKCLLCHLGLPWPTLSFYLHVTNCLNCATESFIVSKPVKPFLSGLHRGNQSQVESTACLI